ncbi:MAG: HAMP domain-containing sensor histidine kinase [Dehalococcoidia bacterium]
MFPNLRAKLTIAFGLVTFLTVLLSAGGTMLLLREREISAARERIGRVGNTVADEVRYEATRGARADRLSLLLQQRADQLNVRFLLIDSKGVVIQDTAGALIDHRADDLLDRRRAMQHSAPAGFGFTTWQEGPIRNVIIFPGGGSIVSRAVISEDYRVLMLVPEADIAKAWEGLAPRLALSGGAALVAAVAVASLLSRSITRPIVRLTRASEEMARGRYDQRIPEEGRDEIGRLAGAFNQMAQEVSRSHQAMRDLNGNVAHELKTPLTSIQGYSQALLDGIVRTPEERAHAARVINDEAERMRRLVEDLLYLSRLESGQLRLERAPVRIGALLEHAAERIAWQVRDSGRELRVHTAIDIPAVSGDERRLEQVLGNLLENALRFTPEGGRITLSAAWSLDRVTVRVHNPGAYIPPEHLPRLFERFYQVDRSRSGPHGGLGLAIAAEIVAAHGGAIGAASDRDTGTEFAVTLPVAALPARGAEADASRATPPATSPAPIASVPARGEPAA